MRKLKYQILFVILFISVGLAAVSSNLFINGTTPIASNPDDFNVYFSDVVVNGTQDLSLVEDKDKLAFDTTFNEIGDSYTLEYDVTNASKDYDASLTINCTSSTEYISIVNNFDTSTNLNARSTRKGTLVITQSKSYVGETILTQDITCTINASAVERTSQGSGEIPGTAEPNYYPMLMASYERNDNAFWAEEYRTKITKILIEDAIDIPNNAVETWDISDTQDGSVMAYIVENDDVYMIDGWSEHDDAYDLVIQSNGVVYANQDMSYWFHKFYSLNTLDGMSNIDTSNVTNMSEMFSGLGESSSDFNMLDLGDKFDTSNVTDMSRMFDAVGAESTEFTLVLGDKFDTSNVTNMSGMFAAMCYTNEIFRLDLGDKFDTSNVTDMSGMFESTGYNSTNLTLDLGNKFDTSNVTNMSGMFYYTGYISENFTLNLGNNFDTRNVTNMSEMFYYTGYISENFTLNLGNKFDTSNVTNMSEMFNGTGYNSTNLNISITIRNPNMSEYEGVFEEVALIEGTQIIVNYTSETEELVNEMLKTKSEGANVIKGVQVD